MVETIEQLSSKIESLKSANDTHWLIMCGILVFFMQCGFAMLEAGSVRKKNTRNILFKNMIDACVGAVFWWALGHSLAYEGSEAFIGVPNSWPLMNNVLEDDGGNELAGWFFQYVFAATAATIVSGAMAERTTLLAYIVYTTMLTAFIYPTIVHWVWSSHGWISAFNENAQLRVIDFAGSGVVHMTGGFAGLVGAIEIGPRLHRFDKDGAIEGHSSTLQVLGTFILWVGWYGFNAGSTLGIAPDLYARDAARSVVTTTLSAATGGITTAVIGKIITKSWNPVLTCNGILSGLVSITAGCSVVYPWHAFFIGIIGSMVYLSTSHLLIRLHIDDPLDAFAVHGATGVWGVLSAGLFAVPQYAYNGSCGAFFGCGEALGSAVVAVITQIAWVVILSFIMFKSLKLLGMLRISKEVEESGLDISKHGGDAYVP